ncbi:MAG: aa3-type cytochrome c oxidase subunit IV [Alphaproteobacteria bacterium]|nr:aa3-type cytochrome c oxidase subunit IV [Alphaproteobacteria bacterium]
MAVDSDLKHHQETWHLFIKGSTWIGGVTVAILVLLAIFVV